MKGARKRARIGDIYSRAGGHIADEFRDYHVYEVTGCGNDKRLFRGQVLALGVKQTRTHQGVGIILDINGSIFNLPA